MSNRPFRFEATPLAGLMLVERLAREDARGFFSRFYCDQAFSDAGHPFTIRQVNHTVTARTGAARGLHFQYPPHAEDKFVSCLKGQIFDVAVDLRRGSPTFLRWHAERLTAENRRSLLIPKGFAHGFQALTDGSELIYLHSHPYSSDSEGGLNIADPRLAIDWPLPVVELSDRDRSHPFLEPDFAGLRI
jgi:dTDP-4-dehydrorhamnose 3,5-epimerase